MNQLEIIVTNDGSQTYYDLIRCLLYIGIDTLLEELSLGTEHSDHGDEETHEETDDGHGHKRRKRSVNTTQLLTRDTWVRTEFFPRVTIMFQY